MTSDVMNWLNQNRYRAYPMVKDMWREKVSPESGLDRVLLDALAFDCDASASSELVMSRIEMSSANARVYFKYGDKAFNIEIQGEGDGDGSYKRVRGLVPGANRSASISMVFSSHPHLQEFIPNGAWTIDCPVLPSRVISLTDGYGVDAISTNGSSGVEGHENAADVEGDVVLEDGYRTSPIISGRRVLVRVGTRYGHDLCGYDYGENAARDCRKPLFFFCGQNAVNSGNIVIQGGTGINVSQGRSYTMKDGTCEGMTIPAIEIVAGPALMDLYKPSRHT